MWHSSLKILLPAPLSSLVLAERVTEKLHRYISPDCQINSGLEHKKESRREGEGDRELLLIDALLMRDELSFSNILKSYEQSVWNLNTHMRC